MRTSTRELKRMIKKDIMGTMCCATGAGRNDEREDERQNLSHNIYQANAGLEKAAHEVAGWNVICIRNTGQDC